MQDKYQKKSYSHSLEATIIVRYDMPEENQRAFWLEVWNLYNRLPKLNDPVLLISGHGLKLLTKSDSVLQARNDF